MVVVVVVVVVTDQSGVGLRHSFKGNSVLLCRVAVMRLKRT